MTFETDSLFKFSGEATIKFKFLYELTDGELTTFNNDIKCDILPEVGSRFASKVNIIDSGKGDVFVTSLWHRVEEKLNRYTIRLLYDGTILVKIVIREFLFCEIIL